MNTHAEYIRRINRVMDHIDDNLEADLRLEHLASVANFSPFHFHRIFRAMVGETLQEFVARRRVERAARMLLSHPDKPITTIALELGLSSSATFARAFKRRFDRSASAWRADPPQVLPPEGATLTPHERGWAMEGDIPGDVSLQTLPETHYVYLRHVGDYMGDTALFSDLFSRLSAWAAPRGLMQDPVFMTLIHDDAAWTQAQHLRIDACLCVPEGTQVDGVFGLGRQPGGEFAVLTCDVEGDDYKRAWSALLGLWLPHSGYQPDDRLCYERYLPNGRVALCLPLRSL